MTSVNSFVHVVDTHTKNNNSNNISFYTDTPPSLPQSSPIIVTFLTIHGEIKLGEQERMIEGRGRKLREVWVMMMVGVLEGWEGWKKKNVALREMCSRL